MIYQKRLVSQADINHSLQYFGQDPVCDFCGETHPVYVYAASRMSTGQYLNCWRWMACATCYIMIEGNDWTVLKRRIESRLRRMMENAAVTIPDRIIQASVEASLRQFFEYAIKEGS